MLVLTVIKLTSAIQNTIALEIEEFHNRTRGISGTLAQLLSARLIIRDDHEQVFIAKVRELSRALSERLNSISKVLHQWTLHVTQGSGTEPISFMAEVTTLKRGTVPFDRNVRALTGEIRGILTDETSKSKSKRALGKQKEEDKLHGTSNRMYRSLATAAQARDALQKVEDATNAMWKLSDELGMSLMHYDSRPGGNTNSANGEEIPKDPYLVSEGMLTMVSTKLSGEIIRLDNLAEPKQAVNLN